MKRSLIHMSILLLVLLTVATRIDAHLPVMITCQKPVPSAKVFCEILTENRQQLRAMLDHHGALLFRDFPVRTPADVSAALKALLQKEPTDCREECMPAEFHIPLRHELCRTDEPLAYVAFFCEVAPLPGTGQTLLASTEKVSQRILQQPAIWNAFNGKMIKYTSRHPPEGSFFCAVNPTHKTWQESFETDDPHVVENICREKGFEYHWLGDWLEVIRLAPAIRGPDEHFDHPYWFNQAHLYHANPRIRGGWLNHLLANLLYLAPTTRPYEVELDDGTPLSQEVLYSIYDILDDETERFDWQEGDLLVLDNIKTLHGKAPHDGPYRILISTIR